MFNWLKSLFSGGEAQPQVSEASNQKQKIYEKILESILNNDVEIDWEFSHAIAFRTKNGVNCKIISRGLEKVLEVDGIDIRLTNESFKKILDAIEQSRINKLNNILDKI